MKAFLLRLSLVLCIVGAPSLATAADQVFNTPGEARIAAIVKEHEGHPDALAKAIAKAVEADPSLAKAVAAFALNASPAVQTALGQGLAEAAVFFASSNSPGAVKAQQDIQAAISSSPTDTSTAFNLAGGESAVLQTLASNIGSQNSTNSGCVSPNRPGHGC